MKYKIFEKKNVTFGIVWGLLSFFIGQFIITLINFIQMVLNYLLNIGLNSFILPNKILEYIDLRGMFIRLLLVVAVAIILSPFARKAFEWFKSISKKSNIWER